MTVQQKRQGKNRLTSLEASALMSLVITLSAGRAFPAWNASCSSAAPERIATLSDAPMPLWEVFIRNRSGMPHKHCGSVHAPDAAMALQAARDVYTRRGESVSLWVVPSSAITASDPADKDEMFEPTGTKIYRHPTFYKVPDDVGHM